MNFMQIFKSAKDLPTFMIILLAVYAAGPLIAETPKLIALVVAPVAIIAITRFSISRDKKNNYKFGWNSHMISEMAATVILIFAAIHYSF